MIWFLIAVLIGIGSGIREHVKYRDTVSTIMGTVVPMFMAGFVAVFICIFAGMAAYDEEPHSYTFDVMAAKDGSSINGRFGIFGGFIDEKSYYFFYRKHSDGRIEQGKILASRTSIYQDQETQSYIKVTKYDSDIGFWGFIPGDDPRYEIHVPDGSVIETVEFDLE
jgi:hypothetical protein